MHLKGDGKTEKKMTCATIYDQSKPSVVYLHCYKFDIDPTIVQCVTYDIVGLQELKLMLMVI